MQDRWPRGRNNNDSSPQYASKHFISLCVTHNCRIIITNIASEYYFSPISVPTSPPPPPSPGFPSRRPQQDRGLFPSAEAITFLPNPRTLSLLISHKVVLLSFSRQLTRTASSLAYQEKRANWGVEGGRACVARSLSLSPMINKKPPSHNLGSGAHQSASQGSKLPEGGGRNLGKPSSKSK